MINKLLRNNKTFIAFIIIILVTIIFVIWGLVSDETNEKSNNQTSSEKNVGAEENDVDEDEPYNGNGLTIIEEDDESKHESIDVPASWEEETNNNHEDKTVDMNKDNTQNSDVTNKDEDVSGDEDHLNEDTTRWGTVF